MEMAASVRVKLSSEAAASISLTPVVSQEMPLHDLMALLLSAVGKDEARVRDLLRRGTVVSEGARYRWASIDAGSESFQKLLGTFPDPEPARVFSESQCRAITFIQARGQATVSREVGSKRRLLQRRIFWEAAMRWLADCPVTYVRYNYRERADEYGAQVAAEAAAAIRESARLLAPAGLRAGLRAGPIIRVTLLCDR